MDVTGEQTGLLMRLMESTTLRSKVIANNVANQNTPGYTRQTVRFEERLRAALSVGGDLEGIAPEIVDDTLTPSRPDGNNVSLEVEMNAMRENRLLYETYTSILAGHFELLRASMSNNG